MAARKTLPDAPGMYVSLSNYSEKAVSDASGVKLYLRSQVGQWYANGELITEAGVPGDLKRLLIQREKDETDEQ